jgi:glycerophosphoryl diester phosphodiesterase
MKRVICFSVAALCGAAFVIAGTERTSMSTTLPVLPLIVAHRGVPSEVPENTLVSFHRAWEQNADAVESDFWLTKDGKVICIHDGDTKRVTGVDLKVPESTLDQLRALDAGKWKGEQFAGEKLPTLAELLATVPAGKKVFLEIKCGPEIVPEFVRDVRASKVKPDQIVVITFKDAVIPAVKAAMPEVPAYLLYGFKIDDNGHPTETPDVVIARAKLLGADGIDLGFGPKVLDVITPAVAAKAKAAGLSFHVWTIDDAAIAKRAIEIGADSITTNRAGGLRRELEGVTP